MIEFHLEWASKSDQTRHRHAGATTSAPRGLALAFGNETIALPMRPLKFHKSFREHGLIPESISVPCSCSRDAAAGNVGSGKQERRPDAHVQKTSLSLSLLQFSPTDPKGHGEEGGSNPYICSFVSAAAHVSVR